MRTIKLISPLLIHIDDHENDYFHTDEMPEASDSEAVFYIEEIKSKIEDSGIFTDEPERGLMAYFRGNPSVIAKVHSMFPTVEERGGKLVGVMTLEVKGHLTEAEIEELKFAVEGQFSDGWGESFEQHPVETIEYDMYVHFWQDSGFKIEVEDDAPSLIYRQAEKPEFVVAVLSDITKWEQRQAEIDLPADEWRIRDAFARAGVTGQGDYTVELWNSKREYLDPLIPENPNLYELNYLANLLEKQLDHEKLFYEGIVKMETEPPDLKRLINLTGHLDSCQMAAGSNDYELGKFYAENDFVAELEDVSDEVFDLLDFEKVGRKMREGEKGVFLDNVYIVQTASESELTDFYDGQMPESQLDPEHVFRVLVTPSPDYGDGIWFDMPGNMPDIETETLTLWGKSLNECVFTDMYSSVPQLKNILSGYEDFYELDVLARKIHNDFRGHEDFMKFKAVLEVEHCAGLEDVVKVSENLDAYEYDPECICLSDYGEKAMKKLHGLGYDDKGMNRFDFAAFGEDQAKRDGVVFTHYGMARLAAEQPILAPEHESGQCMSL